MTKGLLITGATSGIGLACAQQAVQQGHYSQVIITGRQKSKLEETCAKLQSMNNTNILGVILDQTQDFSVQQACTQIINQATDLSAIIANVGVNSVHQYGPKKFHRCHQDFFRDTFNTNVLNNILLLQLLVPILTKQTRSKIILIGSQAYQQGIKGQSPYNISKSALVGLQRSLNGEYQKNALTCDLINPGVVKNHRTEALRSSFNISEKDIVSEEQLAKTVISRLSVPQGEEINV